MVGFVGPGSRFFTLVDAMGLEPIIPGDNSGEVTFTSTRPFDPG